MGSHKISHIKNAKWTCPYISSSTVWWSIYCMRWCGVESSHQQGNPHSRSRSFAQALQRKTDRSTAYLWRERMLWLFCMVQSCLIGFKRSQVPHVLWHHLPAFIACYFNQAKAPLSMIQFNLEAVVPFFVSSEGYGLLWDNYAWTYLNPPVAENALAVILSCCALVGWISHSK